MLHASLPARTLEHLAQALRDWQGQGAVYVDVPWVADARFVQGTRPQWAHGQDITTPYGQLLASGEQAMCAMMLEGKLKPGLRYIGWTPCFRDEQQFDDLHHFYFIKAEIFQPLHASAHPDEAVLELVDQARVLFEHWAHAVKPGAQVVVVPTLPEQWDIEIDGVEVGSYGSRFVPGTTLRYLFGTALAEPRFSRALGLK